MHVVHLAMYVVSYRRHYQFLRSVLDDIVCYLMLVLSKFYGSGYRTWLFQCHSHTQFYSIIPECQTPSGYVRLLWVWHDTKRSLSEVTLRFSMSSCFIF